jgi:putative membrane protein
MLRHTPRPLLALSLGFACAAYFALRFGDLPGASAGSYLSTALIALPAALAFARRFGARRSALALGALSLYGYAIETIGVATGFPYGTFSYGDRLGPKLLGLVPFILPLSWAPLVLGAVAALEPAARRSTATSAVWIAGAALLLVAIDGVLDPGAVRMGLWEWPDGGPFFGVPLTNYVGWLLSSLGAAALLVALAPWGSTRPEPSMLDSALLALAFWTGVAVVSGLWFPAALGVCLYAGLLRLRRALAARRDASGQMSRDHPEAPTLARDVQTG